MLRHDNDLIGRYAAYAAAFELAFHDDDWTRIEPFFTRDVVIRIHTEPFSGLRGYRRLRIDLRARRHRHGDVAIPLCPNAWVFLARSLRPAGTAAR